MVGELNISYSDPKATSPFRATVHCELNVLKCVLFVQKATKSQDHYSLFHQICVSGEDEHSGFIRVASGKKRGYVPCDVLENI